MVERETEAHPNQAIRTAITAPVPGDSEVGERVTDDPLFDFVESQMMKVGSLSHADVRWDEVESSILSLMENKTKDLKLMAHLLQCFQNSQSVERFILSLQVLSDFMNQYWETCFPAPGKRGVLPRKKYFNQIVQRLETGLDKLISKEEFVSKALQAELSEACSAFESATKALSLDGEAFLSLKRKVARWLESCALVEKPPEEAEPVTKEASSSSHSGSVSSVSPAVDRSSDKATKESLQKVADFLAEYEHGYTQSIRLRRFAVWLSIATPPDADHQGETLLRAMTQERINDYLEQLQTKPDLALWRKVEQSLTNAPFWFDGQHLSAQIALKLEKPQWAAAILEETQHFLSRLPELAGLRFKGGTPFVSEETKQWLSSGDQSAAASGGGAESWGDKRQEAMTLAKEGGLSVAMSMLNDGLSQATEPRDQFYWRLIAADLLSAHGLEAIALQQYQSLYQVVLQSSIKEWEPALIHQLEKIVVTE